jgi:hypothetical protein
MFALAEHFGKDNCGDWHDHAAEARRRQGDRGDGDERRGDEFGAGRPGGGGHDAGDRRGGVDAGIADLFVIGESLDQGLVFGNVDRFTGHIAVQPAFGREGDDGELSAGESGGSLRADDERQGEIPGGADDGEVDLNLAALSSLGSGGRGSVSVLLTRVDCRQLFDEIQKLF